MVQEQYVNVGHSSDMPLIVKDYRSRQDQKGGDRLLIRDRGQARSLDFGWIFQPGGRALCQTRCHRQGLLADKLSSAYLGRMQRPLFPLPYRIGS